MNGSIPGKTITPAPEVALRRDMPLIPGDSIPGRALVVVIAIMTFLACLTAGGALLVDRASHEWRSEALSEVTILIKPRSGEDLEGLVAKTVSVASRARGVERVHAYSSIESAELLEPWLGGGLDISLLPIPRVIVVHMGDQPLDELADLKAALAREVPAASLDDHRLWAARLGAMASAIVALAVALFALMIAAMATAIGFATRGAMAGNREIIEVLHLVGASDTFIAKEFQAHFLQLGFRGAMIGGSCAIAFFFAASALSSWWSRSMGGEEIAAMFGAFALAPSGYLALALVGAAVALLTGYLSRTIALRYVQDLR
jgi:cell division transport system permease protein